MDVLTAELPPHGVLPVVAADGARAELIVQPPRGDIRGRLYWLPAMGVPARHYLPLAQALAMRGYWVAIHEWRGIGSSNRRAGRRHDWSYRHILEYDLPAAFALLDRQPPDIPWLLGGHSLGGQLATLFAGQNGGRVRGLILVASGAPFWRHYPQGRLLKSGYAAMMLVARLLGRFPGRRLGFAGNEARGLIIDWARSGRSGRYLVAGSKVDYEAALRVLQIPLLGLCLQDDWLAPRRSLEGLLSKLPQAATSIDMLDGPLLGGPADHFSWMKQPATIANRIIDWDAAPPRD